MSDRGILLGRYQPPHKGHLEVIREILEEVDEIVIGLGSAQRSHQMDDPFTAGERILMLKRLLTESEINLSKVYFVPIPDVKSHSLWVSHVISFSPPFSVVYSGNSLVKRLFKERDFEVRAPPMFNRKEYSESEIRKRIIDNEDWEHLVPEGVAEAIEEIEGEARLRDLSQTGFLQK
ncbi:nicotinamide-nucleotide adenylyltransferase [candidate division MSBL1 archaeon SCGC-AAA259O05]|uniref:Nicotinamide-nucleotide adenylyltransferase n=1 Tax=candidate division MSBL1 archaeon SCGC-AAA259O05 TaxID=1698271 RepID=A0A133UZH3_9EURY|nr:nicotinamide-nucleotide adenylyltransferase [candidate division MSBL1 archaeon SCGC-AAA259O05]